MAAAYLAQFGPPVSLPDIEIPPAPYRFHVECADTEEAVLACSPQGCYDPGIPTTAPTKKVITRGKLIFTRYAAMPRDKFPLAYGTQTPENREIYTKMLKGARDQYELKMWGEGGRSYLHKFVKAEVLYYNFIRHIHNLAVTAHRLEFAHPLENAAQRAEREALL